MNIHIDIFSGGIAELKPKQRTRENALAALQKDPRVSTWDMDKAWLRTLISDLERAKLIVVIPAEYPWHRYRVVEAK